MNVKTNRVVKHASRGKYPSVERVGFHDTQLLLNLPLKALLLKNITLGFKLEQVSCGMQAHMPYVLRVFCAQEVNFISHGEKE